MTALPHTLLWFFYTSGSTAQRTCTRAVQLRTRVLLAQRRADPAAQVRTAQAAAAARSLAEEGFEEALADLAPDALQAALAAKAAALQARAAALPAAPAPGSPQARLTKRLATRRSFAALIHAVRGPKSRC